VAADAATRRALVEKAVELAAEHRADYLELRHSEPVAHDFLPVSRDEKVRMVLELPAEMDGLWAGYNAKVRNQVRKGDKFNLSIRWGGSELIRPFYDVFAVNMRDLGTPVYPRKLFERIVAAFDGSDTDGDRVDGTTSPLGALAEIAVVEHEGKPIGGALLLHDPRIERLTVVPSASVLRQFNHTNANMWMYHRLLMRAVQRGSRWFDFGRSSEDSGTYRFKKQWGAQPRPTVWQYHVRRGDRAVIGAVRPDNPKYQRRIEAWKRLPVWLTRLIGPRIVRGIP
jgi:FemAB-related protein (PEP-CTERM system-associated)